jgi:DNA-directed RNA polymerase specialized sigma24 family protein
MDAARRKAIHEAMVRLSDGDRAAFDVLLDELWPVIAAFAERGVGRGADAEDIAQEVEVHDESALAAQADDGASQEESLLQREVVHALEHAVGSLSEDDRLALGLAGGADLSGVPAATQRKRRALDRSAAAVARANA